MVAAARPHPPSAGVQREWPPGGVEVGDQQAPAGFGHPVHLAWCGSALARRNMVPGERAGDDVKRGTRQVQVLRDANSERHGRQCAAPRVGNRRRRRVHPGDPAGRPRGGAAAWLLLSVLSARRIRAAAMPPGLEPAVTALALRALAPPPAAARGRGQTTSDTPGGQLARDTVGR